MSQAEIRNYATSSDDTGFKESTTKSVSLTTLWRRKHGMPTIQQNAEKQRYLTAEEEQILSVYAARLLDAGSTSISNYVRNQAFEIKCRRSRAPGLHRIAQQIRPPGKGWANTFLERHKEELRIEKPERCTWQRKSLLLGDKVADFVASLSDVKQLCLECAKIKVKLKSLMTRIRYNKSRRLHTFEGSLRAADVSSCKLCCFVLTCSRNWNWPTATKYSLNVHHMENVLGPTLAESKILLSLAIEDEHSKGEYRGWIVPTLLDNAGDVSDPSWSSLTNTVNFAMVRDWLKFCDCNHSNGCRMTSRDNIPFFRLINCTSRLIVDAPPESEFAALSYCWEPGEQQPQRKLNKLPKVVPLAIEDALDAARKLAIPYLWVDRYCIDQDKDSPIKPIQLQNMHKVYRSAYVTIVAGYGDRPGFGLPGVSTRARKPQSSVDTHGHRLICIPDAVREVQDCPWSTRGWTLQENLLSRRRLVFTETQTYFQCWHMHCCEAIPTNLTRAHTKDLTRFKEFNQTFRVFPQKGIGKTGAEIEMRIQEYLSRHLSRESDALNAFLGIFQAFQEIEHPVNNFWGLPMSRFGWTKNVVQQPNRFTEVDQLYSTFLSSLAWSNDLYDHTNAHVLERRHAFPSWTWAAWTSLRKFSRKSITRDSVSPSVKFPLRQGQCVQLENYEQMLGSRNSLSLFQPCILLSGWVTTLWFSEDCSDGDAIPKFKVQSPIPTHKVSILADLQTLEQFRRNSVSEPSPVLLLGGGSSEHNAAVTSYCWKDVQAIILQSLPDGTYMRLGVVTWSCLGRPSIDESQGVMRVKELFEARRVVPCCQCGCQMSTEASFDRYLEDDSNLMEFKNATIRLV
ncbi:HET-domain-containing protein [Macroventuria anomochaeta]|uniref:HET-domain-containing protein n=1 Tax=Macroventuria anomochaeta TaxID=301207 RepID=A0ACB6RNV3_9PLEO|nr:HET-domain-containing protein [Macroventuria anomochaeta]KAF2623080.1 HET-domain-containing protein [Macroventuria anomochaeta]